MIKILNKMIIKNTMIDKNLAKSLKEVDNYKKVEANQDKNRDNNQIESKNKLSMSIQIYSIA